MAAKPRKFSLAYYTSAPLDPLGAVRLAARLGYDYVGLRPAQPRPDAPVQSLVGDPARVREVVACTADTGVGILDLEFIWLDAGFQPHRCKGLAELGAALGARSILVGPADTDLARLANSYAQLCEVAHPAGLAVDLEVTAYSAVTSLAGAVHVLGLAGNPPNAGILIDSLHLHRAGDDPAQVASLPRHWLHSAQICDAPGGTDLTQEEAIAIALGGRLPPGEGGIDLLALLAHLPADLPLSLEVPNTAMTAKFGVEDWSRRVLASARTLVDRVSTA